MLTNTMTTCARTIKTRPSGGRAMTAQMKRHAADINKIAKLIGKGVPVRVACKSVGRSHEFWYAHVREERSLQGLIAN